MSEVVGVGCEIHISLNVVLLCWEGRGRGSSFVWEEEEESVELPLFGVRSLDCNALCKGDDEHDDGTDSCVEQKVAEKEVDKTCVGVNGCEVSCCLCHDTVLLKT